MKKRFLIFIFALVFFVTGMVNTNAADEYKGEYTIEYLIKNYNVVTLGTKNRYQYSIMDADLNNSGYVHDVFDIGGPVLIRGDYTGNTSSSNQYANEFAQKTDGVPSYIKGKIGEKIKAGSPESKDESNIYVGSSNTVEQIDGKYIVNSVEYNSEYTVYNSNDYLDFDKLYDAVLDESLHMNKGKLLENNLITEPGYYYVDNPGTVTIINYNPNKLYVITYEGTNVYNYGYRVTMTPGGGLYQYNDTASDAVYCGRNNPNDSCSGNIIWNMPNARYVYLYHGFKGHLIAPNADVELSENHYPGTIIANSISSPKNSYTAIQFNPYKIDEKLPIVEGENTIEKIDDVDDDFYVGNYTIEELLKHYSVVTLGQKEYEENAKLATKDANLGTANLYHIGGQFLISGDLGYKGVEFVNNGKTSYGRYIQLDFKGFDIDVGSYLKGNLRANSFHDSVIKNLNYRFHVGRNNHTESSGLISTYITPNASSCFSVFGMLGVIRFYNEEYEMTQHNLLQGNDNYINFARLYNNIVKQQKEIDVGQSKKADEDGNVHLKIGGNYVLENIEEVNEIVFDNFEANENKLTIITIKDSEDINFPKITGEGNLIVTNDSIGGFTYDTSGKKITYEEKYYGNIVWNIPNATYIKLAEDAPFFGHIIAPNADMETPELHFAGAVIVNSLYTEGNTEAHFYPIAVDDDLYRKFEYIDISGTKIWDDKDNQDGKRAESITINLLADGEKVDSVTITEEDNWKYEFKNLVKENGNGEINYTITEDAVENYSTEINGYDITNSYTPEKTSLTVNKVWKDEDDKDKIRPESIEVELYANGKKVDSAELSEENDWTYIFTEIDMYANGEKIEYTVKEKEVEGYATEITGNQETGYTIINTHKIKEVKPEKDNPVTYDNVMKFAIISVITTLFLVIGIIVYQKNKKED